MIEEIINKIKLDDSIKDVDMWNSELSDNERKELLDKGNIF